MALNRGLLAPHMVVPWITPLYAHYGEFTLISRVSVNDGRITNIWFWPIDVHEKILLGKPINQLNLTTLFPAKPLSQSTPTLGTLDPLKGLLGLPRPSYWPWIG